MASEGSGLSSGEVPGPSSVAAARVVHVASAASKELGAAPSVPRVPIELHPHSSGEGGSIGKPSSDVDAPAATTRQPTLNDGLSTPRQSLLLPLEGIIFNRTGVEMLSQFCKREFTDETIAFFDHVERFRCRCNDVGAVRPDGFLSRNLVRRARAIYNSFVVTGARSEVTLPMPVKERIQAIFDSTVSSEDDDDEEPEVGKEREAASKSKSDAYFARYRIPPTVFNEAQAVAFGDISADILPRFHKSEQYRAYARHCARGFMRRLHDAGFELDDDGERIVWTDVDLEPLLKLFLTSPMAMHHMYSTLKARAVGDTDKAAVEFLGHMVALRRRQAVSEPEELREEFLRLHSTFLCGPKAQVLYDLLKHEIHTFSELVVGDDSRKEDDDEGSGDGRRGRRHGDEKGDEKSAPLTKEALEPMYAACVHALLTSGSFRAYLESVEHAEFVMRLCDERTLLTPMPSDDNKNPTTPPNHKWSSRRGQHHRRDISASYRPELNSVSYTHTPPSDDNAGPSSRRQRDLEVAFRYVMRDSERVEKFLQFCRAEHSEDNIFFWIDVEIFKQLRPAERSVAAANELIDQYLRPAEHAHRQIFLLDGPRYSVELSPQMRERIMRELADTPEGAPVDPFLFDEVQQHTEVVMRGDSFERYFNTPAFQADWNEGGGRRLAFHMSRGAQGACCASCILQ